MRFASEVSPAEPIVVRMPRTVPPVDYPGSLTRNDDLDFERWLADHRRASAFAETPRGQIEAAIGSLIDLLDRLDGDTDAESIDEREPDHEGEERFQPATLA